MSDVRISPILTNTPPPTDSTNGNTKHWINITDKVKITVKEELGLGLVLDY